MALSSSIFVQLRRCTQKTLRCCKPRANAIYVTNCNSYSSSAAPEENKSPPSTLNSDLINHLERTSLVGFGSEEAVARLQEAIKFASVLYEVNTDGVKPMDSVLENETIHLRADEPTSTNRDDVISNAAITIEDYFVAPPGNIPLEASKLAENLAKHQLRSNSKQ